MCDVLCVDLAWLNRMAYGADAVVTFANNAYEQVTGLAMVSIVIDATLQSSLQVLAEDAEAMQHSGASCLPHPGGVMVIFFLLACLLPTVGKYYTRSLPSCSRACWQMM